MSDNEKKPEAGDVVQFPRPLGYSHYGVCVGDDQVAHMGKDGPHMGLKSEIKIESIEKVAAGGSYKVHNRDERMTPLPVEEIVENAKAKVGEQRVWTPDKNCEEFATGMRYGEEKGHSDQAEKAKNAMGSGLEHLQETMEFQ
ncbi:phospholipase A and acyltransferase 4-like [Engraulis encrasicolus]|uniref:phospholipase A and acyltransferase 4-like n=1 Tax=Engraulis encrasicolus TaxID=184585 RepID=UPI002FD66690